MGIVTKLKNSLQEKTLIVDGPSKTILSGLARTEFKKSKDLKKAFLAAFKFSELEGIATRAAFNHLIFVPEIEAELKKKKIDVQKFKLQFKKKFPDIA